MDVLIGGLAVALGLAFITLDAILYPRLDLLAWGTVLVGGLMVALFGLAILAGSGSRGRGRAARSGSACTDGGADVP